MSKIIKYPNYINGEWLAPSGEKYFEQRNPARLSELTGLFPLSEENDTSDAIEAARLAFRGWKSLSAFTRADYLKKFLQLMKERKRDIAGIITLENGKTLAESLVEVDAAIKEVEWQINEGLRLFGATAPSALENTFSFVIHEPLGVVSVISPWNFPFNVPCRKAIPALISGNVCVFKPASLTPRTGYMLTQLMDDAGIPKGVFNMITGSGSKVGEILISDERIKAISFTGSTEVGMHVNQRASERGIPTQLELGGKNPVIVLEDADLDLAVKASVRAAFACAGQWCTSTSRAIVVNEIAREFTEKVVKETKTILTGEGMQSEIGMGPVCGTGQLENILKYIQYGIDEGASLLTGGNRLSGGIYDDGCFVAPTVFGDVKPEMTIAREEIFGPVLSIIAVEDYNEAIKVANDTKYGLCSSIFTNNLSKAMKFISETEVGLTHVNMMTAYKEPQLPFGGIKESGVGIPEAGSTGVEFFTNRKSVYVNYK